MHLLHGIDLIEIERMHNFLNQPKRLARIFTPQEIAHANPFSAKRQMEWYAGRFAAKEAAIKALYSVEKRTPIRFLHIEVTSTVSGAPHMTLHANALDVVTRLSISEITLSITHNRDHALASVIMLRKA
ncbi:holo-ACP synthase [Ferroacidibacillus organovorans]|uniref:Holo-[acyl-carrier-protein] synthase n=1 Tax=Ferroacidibacillus organovorans TaxID=1765683 RepID=A0A853K9I6_9BACL|nr:holo-ACP synthase [Ferroacidibacillus organovorans]KYP81047.1 hypothetical protein AYJ22_08940 [Ferroacidibacillus organovorans]OAG93676.1 hypothetical protein AYW79_09205 [Ferroacidibacillus organovorans]